MSSFSQVCPVQFSSNKNCFILVPRQWSQLTEGDTISLESLEVRGKFFFTWNGEFSRSNCIEINGLYGARLGLKDGEDVIASKAEQPPASCRQCVVEPISENDWELLSLNAEIIENSLMNQIRVVWSGVCFPIWISRGSICLYVKVSSLAPNEECVLLEEMTEVIVAPPGTKRGRDGEEDESATSQLETTSEKSESSFLTSMITSFSGYFAGGGGDSSLPALANLNSEGFETMHSIDDSSKYALLRVLPYTFLRSSNDEQEPLWNTVFVNHAQHNIPLDGEAIAKLKVILSPKDRKVRASTVTQDKKDKQDHQSDPIRDEGNYLTTFVKVIGTEKCPLDCIVPGDTVRRQLGLSISSLVFLEKTELGNLAVLSPIAKKTVVVTKKVTVQEAITLRPLLITQKSSEELGKHLVKYLRSRLNLLCCLGTLISIEGEDFLVQTTDEQPCYVLNKRSFKNVEGAVEVGLPLVQLVKTSWGALLPIRTIQDIDRKLFSTPEPDVIIGGVHKTYHRMKLIVQNFLNGNTRETRPCSKDITFRGCLLLCGLKGSGKKTLLKKLTTELSSPPNFVYVHDLDCKLLRGKRVENLHKEFLQVIAEAYYRQPSVLVLHDLDVLIPSPSKPEEEVGVEALYYYRLTVLLVNLMKLIENENARLGRRLVLIATCKSRKSVHQNLVQVKGRHFFNQVIELTRLNPDERTDVIVALLKSKALIKNSCIETLDLKAISRKTEGYLPLDLRVLVERSLHSSLLRHTRGDNGGEGRSGDFEILQSDFDRALENFTPITLQGVKLRPKSDKKLKDVGGHEDIKKILVETILWPSKYPHVFAKCPLRPQSCILLHGSPGTGKTLLVEALANEFEMNFISVEGPELLSKYIGASEQAVRELFLRAQAAKPCILFFDEFDSIAQKRGLDSTGVTDRIVNQLLTQMDGVEGLERGVFIIAATSRLDLLDPALLRPGRFDKCLHCLLPNESERRQILSVLSAKLELEEDVDFNLIAQATEHYSGADLQSILYSAQIEALHEKLEAAKTSILRGGHSSGAPGQRDDHEGDGKEINSSPDDDEVDGSVFHSRVLDGPSEVDIRRRNVRGQKENESDRERLYGDEEETAIAGDYGDEEEGSDIDQEARAEGPVRILVKLNAGHIASALQQSKPSVNPVQENNARTTKLRAARVTFM